MSVEKKYPWNYIISTSKNWFLKSSCEFLNEQKWVKTNTTLKRSNRSNISVKWTFFPIVSRKCYYFKTILKNLRKVTKFVEWSTFFGSLTNLSWFFLIKFILLHMFLSINSIILLIVQEVIVTSIDKLRYQFFKF